MTLELTVEIITLFCLLFIVGSSLCLPLYKWDYKRFFASELWVKVLWWIPLFFGFLLLLFLQAMAAILVASAIALLAFKEFRARDGSKNYLSLGYFIGFLIALLHTAVFYFNSTYATQALIVVCFASVLSDVFAFFFGKFFGKSPLPQWINDKKYWEGVVGQIVGALAGYGLVLLFTGISGYWLAALLVGIASAVGDLANSIAKRQLNIKDWGRTIPGHGGVLDRFSSLSLAVAVMYWITRT
jgi:phosphatidate cytidylyltransferase